ncbi:predicted protein [Postia placenta Mad-698-R]|nr:predicted protein [Postia placenta Mad-698-R]
MSVVFAGGAAYPERTGIREAADKEDQVGELTGNHSQSGNSVATLKARCAGASEKPENAYARPEARGPPFAVVGILGPRPVERLVSCTIVARSQHMLLRNSCFSCPVLGPRRSARVKVDKHWIAAASVGIETGARCLSWRVSSDRRPM